MTSYPTPQELKGAIQGTLLYLGLYAFVFIPFQSFTKFAILSKHKREAKAKGGKVSFRAIKYYNSRDLLALTGDRTVGNFVEQAILFLPLLWLYTIFVDPSDSFTIAAIYTGFRAIYPIVYMKSTLLLVSTAPGYLILLYMFVQIALKSMDL